MRDEVKDYEMSEKYLEELERYVNGLPETEDGQLPEELLMEDIVDSWTEEDPTRPWARIG